MSVERELMRAIQKLDWGQSELITPRERELMLRNRGTAHLVPHLAPYVAPEIAIDLVVEITVSVGQPRLIR